MIRRSGVTESLFIFIFWRGGGGVKGGPDLCRGGGGARGRHRNDFCAQSSQMGGGGTGGGPWCEWGGGGGDPTDPP